MNPWIHVTGWTLIHFVWQGGLLAIATALALRFWRRGSEAQYTIACLGLGAMVVASAVTAAVLARGAALPSGEEFLPAGSGSPLDLTGPQLAPSDLPSLTKDAGVGTDLESLLPAVVSTWSAGVLLLLVRFSGGCWRVHRLRLASIDQATSAWQSLAERLASRLRMGVAFRVVESTLVDAPTVIGWIRPVILLPIAVLTNLTPRQIEALIAHELAHVRRRDYAVNLLQTAAEAFFFFHPGVWWVSARIREAREYCCDDVAVGICAEPAEYAEALAEVASWRTREAALAVGAAGGSMLTRIQRVLRVQESDEPRTAGAFAMLAVLMAVVAGLAGLSARTPSNAPDARGAVQGPAEDRRVLTTDHFQISYPPDLDLHAERFALEAERAHEQISGDLKHTLAFKVPIVLYRTAGDLEAALQTERGGHQHVTSFDDGARDRIVFAIDVPPDQWFGAITHEVTHVFGFDIVPGAATPRWISEGLAEYERGTWDPNDLVALRDAVRANAVPRVREWRGVENTRDRGLLYGVAHAAFEFIESRWGKSGVRQFLLAVRQTVRSGGDPYTRAFQISEAEFDQAFAYYLQHRFSKAADRSPAARFDLSASVRIEGEISGLRFPVAAGLACLEVWATTEAERRQRWTVECGGTAGEDLMRLLKPGDRVIVTGAPARGSVARRMLIQTLERPADALRWPSTPG